MSSKTKVYNFKLFKRLLNYIKSYRQIFVISIISVFGLSVFGALRPVVLEKIVDENLTSSNYDFFSRIHHFNDYSIGFRGYKQLLIYL